MNVFDTNIKKEIDDYSKNIISTNSISFLSQFELHHGNKDNFNEQDNNLEEPSIMPDINKNNFTFSPGNHFDKINMLPGSRRDNSLLFRENYKNLEKKKENESFFDTGLNNSNILASGQEYNNELNNFKNRLSDSIKLNNNTYDKDTMYQKIGDIDGKPITDLSRVKYKNQNAKFNPLNSNGKPAEAIEEGSSQGPSEADMQASSRNLLDVPTNKEDKAEKKVEMNENDKKQIEEMSLSDSEQSDLGSISEITSINKSIRKSSHKQPSGVKLRK